ncbi:MAG TPA: phosphate ABC transporter permease [Synergistaceae bacterium]|jgi:phosphate transport system permease protein|nr:phosphate ABC transporter permease [Synergistaceae bacterium]
MRCRERVILVVSLVSGFLVCVSVFILMAFLLRRGLPALRGDLLFGNTPVMEAILGLKPVWDGIWPAMAGTLGLLILTMSFAIIPGVGCGIFLACYATPRQKEGLGLAVDLLAGIPSIVMGLFGFILILFLRRTFLPRGTTCMLLASFCLALLVLPSLIASTVSSLEGLPEELSLTAEALGFSQGQALRHVLLPAAGNGILSGIMLAMGRTAEDTAVIMLTGVVANAGFPAGLLSKFEALPFFVYYTAAQYADQQELTRGFGAILVLLLLSGGLLLGSWYLQRKLELRWRGERG